MWWKPEKHPKMKTLSRWWQPAVSAAQTVKKKLHI